MIRVTVDGKKYFVPSEFKELNIKTYQELGNVEEKNDVKKLIKYLEVLTGLKSSIIKRFQLDDLKEITKNLNYFGKEQELIDAVKIKGKIYVFDIKLENMRFDMYIDLDEMSKSPDVIIDNLHLIMALLYRPVKKVNVFKRIFKHKLIAEDYDSDQVKERALFFKENMMMDKVLGAMFFFINLRTKYLQDIKDFS